MASSTSPADDGRVLLPVALLQGGGVLVPVGEDGGLPVRGVAHQLDPPRERPGRRRARDRSTPAVDQVVGAGRVGGVRAGAARRGSATWRPARGPASAVGCTAAASYPQAGQGPARGSTSSPWRPARARAGRTGRARHDPRLTARYRPRPVGPVVRRPRTRPIASGRGEPVVEQSVDLGGRGPRRRRRSSVGTLVVVVRQRGARRPRG